jgi:hypothetical protein
MHWRKPFPPRRPSVLAELIAVVRTSFRPDKMMAPPPVELPDELPAAPSSEQSSQMLTDS